MPFLSSSALRSDESSPTPSDLAANPRPDRVTPRRGRAATRRDSHSSDKKAPDRNAFQGVRNKGGPCNAAS